MLHGDEATIRAKFLICQSDNVATEATDDIADEACLEICPRLHVAYPTSTRDAPESSEGRRTLTSGDIADDGEIGDDRAPPL